MLFLPNPFSGTPTLDCDVAFETLVFLQAQEMRPALSSRNAGGVRKLVQPLDGVESVRSPARAAHTLCSKLEPLPERRLPPPARISKDELDHDQKYANPRPYCLCWNRRSQSHPPTRIAGASGRIRQ